MEIEVTLFKDYDGDWSQLRINDRLVKEGHSISGDEVLGILESMGYLKYNDYSREYDHKANKEVIHLNNEELPEEQIPGWLKDFLEEFPGESIW